MKKITAVLLLFAITFSLAACSPEQPQTEQPDPEVSAGADIPPVQSTQPVEDPAGSYTVSESDAEEVLEKTGVYFFAIDTIEDVSHSLIGSDELEWPYGEMSFSSGDGLKVVYRVRKDEMINADQAKLFFGSREWEIHDSVRIGNNITDLYYNEGGEAILCWYDVEAGINCCIHYSSSDDRESIVLYANLLYAFINSDIKPQN